MEACQTTLNDQTREQLEPVQKSCCFCIPRRIGIIVLTLIKLMLSLGLLLLLIDIVFKFNSLDFLLMFYYIIVWIAVCTDMVDVVISLVVFISVCLKNRRLMKMYYMYSVYIFGTLSVVCCLIVFISTANTLILLIYLCIFFLVFTLIFWRPILLIVTRLMEACQPSLNEETTEQSVSMSRWKFHCVFHRLFVLVLLKLVVNLGLLESIILCLRFVIDSPKPGLLIALLYVAIFIDIVDIITGLVIIISVCMKNLRIMEMYYRYSIYIFGSLSVMCCIIIYLVLRVMGPVSTFSFMFFLVLLMQAYLNHLVKSEVLKMRSNEQSQL